MSTTPNNDPAFDKIRRAAIEVRLREAAEGAGIQVRPGAFADLARRAFGDHTADANGFLITRDGGRHVPAVDFLNQARKSAPWYFADAGRRSSAAADRGLVTDEPLPPGVTKRIQASEMGSHIDDIAAGKVIVEVIRDGAG
jgi:hypothetical protein